MWQDEPRKGTGMAGLQEMKEGRRRWTEWGGKELMGESRDPHGTEMSVGMDSRCEECRDFSFPPAVVSHVSLPWSQQINGENSGRGVQCHPPPVAGAEEESLVPVPDQVMLHGSKLLNLAGGPRQGVVIVLQAPIYFLRN